MVLILLIVALVVAGWFYFSYAAVIKAKNMAREASSGIDVQLRKRYDLIPNILTIAQKFMDHEKGLIEEITKLRTMAMNAKAGTSASMAANAQLDSLLGQLKVSVENYPNLKSDETMVQAMQTYNEVEEHIAAARRFYNSAVLELNNAVEIFPSSIFASMVGAKKQEFFQADEAERKAINAADYLK